MAGPSWLAAALAAVMIAIAACAAARICLARTRGLSAEYETDGLHLVMGIAMTGMLEPRLSFLPQAAWQATFAAAAAWFGWRAVRFRARRSLATSPGRHPMPHLIECLAMVYMLLPAGPVPGRPGPETAMPGMAATATAANPAVAVLLALFMLGYVLWATDSLASGPRPGNRQLGPAPGGTARTALAPRLAAAYKIAMSLTMGYMLIQMA